MENSINSFLGKSFVMPEATENDNWIFGGFVVRVVDLDIANNLVIVEDKESDFFTIEPGRLIPDVD